MVNRTLKFIFSQSQWCNIFQNMILYISLLGYLFFVGIGVKGEITNDQQENITRTGNAHHAERQLHEYNTASFPEYSAASFPSSYPSQYPTRDENLRNNNYQRPSHHRQPNYRNQNYDRRQYYHQNIARNGTETEQLPHHQRFHQRGQRQYYRDENTNFQADSNNHQYDRQYDNGNYTTYYNHYNPYVPPDQQYYYDPSYNQQNVVPPHGQQNYAYPPEQYYYTQPAVQPNDAFGYADPQYGQQLNYPQPQYYHQQQQYNQDFGNTPTDGRPQFTLETQSSISDASQSTKQRKTTVPRKKPKSIIAKTTSAMKTVTVTQMTTQTTARTVTTVRTTTMPSTSSVRNVQSDMPPQLHQQQQGLVHPFPQIHPNPPQWDPNYIEPFYNPQFYAQYPAQFSPHIQSQQQQQQQQQNPNYVHFYSVNQSSFNPYPPFQTDAPQQWDPNVNPVFPPQYDDYWYPDNNPNNPVQWQPHDANQYWPPTDNLHQHREQHQQNIDWQVFDLNYDEVPFDLTLHQNLPPQQEQQYQQKTKRIGKKQETTERNYNTFAPGELRDRTSTVNDSINYNTYSYKEWQELQGIKEKSQSVENEYAEYETSELEEDDSDETRNYNTLDPTNATTEPTEEINYNTYGPGELKNISQPKDINFNTHGNKPYFHTDPHSLEKRYKDYPSTRNASAKPSCHTPLARLSKYFASAKPPIFDLSNISVKIQSTQLPRLEDDIEISLTTSTIGKEIYEDRGDYGNTRSESFLNRWLFQRKGTSRNNQPPLPSDHTSFFAAHSTSDHWIAESQLTKDKQIPSLLDLVVSPVTSRNVGGMYNDNNYGNTISEPFLNRWLFGRKRTDKSTRIPSTFDHRSFFAAPSTSDHWLLSSHNFDSASADMEVFNDDENEQLASSVHLFEEPSKLTTVLPIPATLPAHQTEIKMVTDDNYESLPRIPPLYTHPSFTKNAMVDVTTPRLTPATPSSSIDGTSRKVKNQVRIHHHLHHQHHKHNHTHDHDQIEVDCTLPMSPQPRDVASTKPNSSQHATKRKYRRKNTDPQLHLNSSNEQHSNHQKRLSNSTKKKTRGRPKKQGQRYERDISLSSDSSSPENRSSPLDVSDAQDYCAWANQQRYLQSMERLAKADRQNQKISRRPLFSEFSFRSINPEYMKTPYWTGSTSYVWMPGGKKKKVIDLPDESYGLLIEDSEEWWQAQRREAKRLRAYKYLGLNREGYRKSRLEAQEEAKKSKLGRLFGFVKNVFQKITGTKKKEDDPKQSDGKDSEQSEERRNWDRNDRRNQNYRPYRNPIRNYRNQNYRYHQNNPDQNYHPDQNYKNPFTNYNNPNSGNTDQNYHSDSNVNNPYSQKYYKNENKRFNYKPFHNNYNNPDNPDNRVNKPPNYRTNYARQTDVHNTNNDDPRYNYPSTTIHISSYENSNTRSMDK